ncbi:uncharacterized protein LOC111040349 [Myzus persicae]|uniref:uncharacterized protein LOC111040349 n=1 Tax=Myzus persicae TaxID=13164 RepID=UPI000B9363D5|nr:uncharacterized protein LOC111040349 [Myzus persicae]
MIACERSDNDDCGGSGVEQFDPLLAPQLRMNQAESSVGVSGNGCVEQARCSGLADRSMLLHGLCAATIALATVRFLPSFTTLAMCLVGVCVLALALRMLSCSLFRFRGPCGHRSTKANAHNNDGCPSNGGPSVPQRRPLEPLDTPTSGGDALSLVKRGLRLLMRVMLGVPRSLVIRPKRSRRSTRRSRDTASRATVTVTTVTACSTTTTKSVGMVTVSRAGNDYVHRSQRQYAPPGNSNDSIITS